MADDNELPANDVAETTQEKPFVPPKSEPVVEINPVEFSEPAAVKSFEQSQQELIEKQIAASREAAEHAREVAERVRGGQEEGVMSAEEARQQLNQQLNNAPAPDEPVKSADEVRQQLNQQLNSAPPAPEEPEIVRPQGGMRAEQASAEQDFWQPERSNEPAQEQVTLPPNAARMNATPVSLQTPEPELTQAQEQFREAFSDRNATEQERAAAVQALGDVTDKNNDGKWNAAERQEFEKLARETGVDFEKARETYKADVAEAKEDIAAAAKSGNENLVAMAAKEHAAVMDVNNDGKLDDRFAKLIEDKGLKDIVQQAVGNLKNSLNAEHVATNAGPSVTPSGPGRTNEVGIG